MSEYRRKQAWQAGYKAALACKTSATNNRPRGTIFHDDWKDGWNDGRRLQGLPQDDAMSEWIPHSGGPMPVDGKTRVRVEFRDGFEGVYLAGDLDDSRPSLSCWVHSKCRADIIAYRLETPNEDQ